MIWWFEQTCCCRTRHGKVNPILAGLDNCHKCYVTACNKIKELLHSHSETELGWINFKSTKNDRLFKIRHCKISHGVDVVNMCIYVAEMHTLHLIPLVMYS